MADQKKNKTILCNSCGLSGQSYEVHNYKEKDKVKIECLYWNSRTNKFCGRLFDSEAEFLLHARRDHARDRC